MPQKSLTSSFAIADASNEVVCPLRNQDGSNCRKRCLGEKRFRSMQEHIRRAHPEHYIPKLPATEESFFMMINTPPSERPPPQTPRQQTSQLETPSGSVATVPRGQVGGFLQDDRHVYFGDDLNVGDDYPVMPAANAAATALAQLHGTHKEQPTEWDSELGWMPGVTDGTDMKPRMTSSGVELPPLHMTSAGASSTEPFPNMQSQQAGGMLPSLLGTSPPDRLTTLPPLNKSFGPPARPRKQSVSKRAREPHHKRQKSKGAPPDWFKRGIGDGSAMSELLRPVSQDKSRPYSAEPAAARSPWEDLIDAAASATEDIDDDRTPVPPSPLVKDNRVLIPPFPHQHFSENPYQSSPLQRALTPPQYAPEPSDPFPSVESGQSGENFHIGAHGLNDSSPQYSSQHTQIYCAACQSVSLLRESYACTECICGICQACVEVLMAEQGARRKCPRCATIGGRFKPFQLDIR